jgi:hypothetical protein
MPDVTWTPARSLIHVRAPAAGSGRLATDRSPIAGKR